MKISGRRLAISIVYVRVKKIASLLCRLTLTGQSTFPEPLLLETRFGDLALTVGLDISMI
jgi:hypothetical protein